MWRGIRAFWLGLVAAWVGCVALTVVAHFALSDARLKTAIGNAITAHQLDYVGLVAIKEHFGECTMLMTEHLRPRNPIRNAIDTFFAHDIRYHPCDVLGAVLFGRPPTDVRLGPVYSYLQYPFGQRHLLGLLLSVMEIWEIRQIYAMLSALTVALLMFAGRERPLIAVPIGVSLLIGCSYHLLADNIGIAPAYIVGIGGLGLIVALRERLATPERRIAAFAMLAALLTFVEGFTGAVPVTLALAMVMNHVYLVRATAWRGALIEAATVIGCFVGGFLATAAVRLALIAALFDVPWKKFFSVLFVRFSYEGAGAPFSFLDVLARMWQFRHQLVPGGDVPSTAFLALGLASWLVVSVVALRRRRLGPDIGILALGAAGALSWFPLTPNHTLIHAFQMDRILAVPVALGVAAMLLVLRERAQGEGQSAHRDSACPARQTRAAAVRER